MSKDPSDRTPGEMHFNLCHEAKRISEFEETLYSSSIQPKLAFIIRCLLRSMLPDEYEKELKQLIAIRGPRYWEYEKESQPPLGEDAPYIAGLFARNLQITFRSTGDDRQLIRAFRQVIGEQLPIGEGPSLTITDHFIVRTLFWVVPMERFAVQAQSMAASSSKDFFLCMSDEDRTLVEDFRKYLKTHEAIIREHVIVTNSLLFGAIIELLPINHRLTRQVNELITVARRGMKSRELTSSGKYRLGKLDLFHMKENVVAALRYLYHQNQKIAVANLSLIFRVALRLVPRNENLVQKVIELWSSEKLRHLARDENQTTGTNRAAPSHCAVSQVPLEAVRQPKASQQSHTKSSGQRRRNR